MNIVIGGAIFIFVMVIMFWTVIDQMNLASRNRRIEKRINAKKLAVDLAPLYGDWLKKLELGNGNQDKIIIDNAFQKILDKIEEEI